MKKIFIINSLLLVSSFSFGQVIIGDAVGTATDKTSVLLEFSKEKKGLVLPYVRTMPTTATGLVEGTILLDASSSGGSRIKFYNANTTAGTAGWKDLSGENGDVATQLTNQPTNNGGRK